MKKVAFTAVDDRLYYAEGTHIFANSFKRFHPDIDLVIFRQDTVDKLFKEREINWYQAKPHFASLLWDDYDLICNIDADTVITARMDKVFDDTDYDVAMPWNFNDYENAAFENITEEMYLQAGLVSSTSKAFWEGWQSINESAMDYVRKENDTVNLLIYNKLKGAGLRILDKDYGYYGCKSLGREPLFYVEDDRLMCKKEQVFAYHFARGPVFPKLNYPEMPFKDDVKEWLTRISYYGQSVKVCGL